jgi:hypothetical protein
MLKKLLKKMGLVTKGKTTIKEPNTLENLKKIEGVSINTLTVEEINFILTKLRSANYIGSEFEYFSNIWIKLTKLKEQ